MDVTIPPQTIHDEFVGDCHDVLQGITRRNNNVCLIDCSPRLCPIGRTMEYSIVRSARISMNAGLKTPEEDNRLVRYLIRNKHTSPLETVRFTFRIRCPIFVARQIMRHRTFSYNEVSARYSRLSSACFLPTDWKKDHPTNKQSSGEIIQNQNSLNAIDDIVSDVYHKCWKAYTDLLDQGVSKELARIVLPVASITEFFMTGDLNNLLKFFDLRCAPDTQEQTREVACSMRELIKPLLPIVFDTIENLPQTSQLQQPKSKDFEEKQH